MTNLQSNLQESLDAFQNRNPQSLDYYQQSCKFMPGGNTRSVIWHEPYPLRITRGENAIITDVDGHDYVDFLGEYSAGLFGHSHTELHQASIDAMGRGISFGAHNEFESRFSQLLVERFPPLERLRFTNSGTEANMMAISTSRVMTGKSKVLVFRGGYHGGVFYFGTKDSALNAPFPWIVAPFNDLETATALLAADADNIACVLVEPMQGSAGCIPASKSFLQGLRKACDKTGALLIFDEVMTSRLGSGGASSYYSVMPDLITLGKYLGGGHSFGAFGGRAELMARFDPSRQDALVHAGTFQNNVLTMATGIKVLESVFTSEVADAHFQLGEQWRDRLNQKLTGNNLGLVVSGLGSLLNIHPTRGIITSIDDLKSVDDRLRLLLFLKLLEKGFYIARRGYMSLSLALEGHHLEAFENALLDTAETLRPWLPGNSE